MTNPITEQITFRGETRNVNILEYLDGSIGLFDQPVPALGITYHEDGSAIYQIDIGTWTQPRMKQVTFDGLGEILKYTATEHRNACKAAGLI